jgi:hypothetical protein
MDGHVQIALDQFIENDQEGKIQEILSSFSCPLNKDVECFLKEKAVEFTRQGISQTHLVFASYRGKERLIGYYALALKYLLVKKGVVSKTMNRSLNKYGKFNGDLNAYIISAPLIGQLGKNYADGLDKLITGDELLKYACDKIRELYSIIGGGRIIYLECEDKFHLIDFYRRNGFIKFGSRQLDPDETETLSGAYLVQMLKKL